jgi:hypothetical protein
MPTINALYARKHGNKQTVTVLDVKDGQVKLKDTDGVHFVSESVFGQFFKEVKAG